MLQFDIEWPVVFLFFLHANRNKDTWNKVKFFMWNLVQRKSLVSSLFFVERLPDNFNPLCLLI